MSRFSIASLGEHFAPHRFVLFGALMIASGGAALMTGASPHRALLIGFDIGAALFLATIPSLLKSDVHAMRRIAAHNDANRPLLLVLSVLLSLVIFVAVGTLVAGPATLRAVDGALIVATLCLAWTFANTVFMLHYAHLYYLQHAGRDRGGLEVPGTPEPDYRDFAYFAFTLGMTFQTSDITIASRHLRGVVLFHCLAAFLFNIGILAFTINSLGG